MLHKATPCGSGERLDSFLARTQGSMGVRGWRRLIQSGRVRVGMTHAKPGQIVRKGDEIEIAPPENIEPKCEYLGRQRDYLFFYKPPLMHSAMLAGGSEDSLEKEMPFLAQKYSLPANGVLLQRLDYGTSGIISSAITQEAQRYFRNAEGLGKCRKSYLALLEGRLEESVVAKNRLDVNGGKKVRIREEASDKNSWTHFQPLWTGHIAEFGDTVSIAACTLCAGKRHQIRAHAAALGHALYADELYGASNKGNFLLTHFRLEFGEIAFQHLSEISPFVKMGCRLQADGTVRCTL